MVKMEIKPDFYDEFVCAAGDCPFTCCQEWRIGIDPDTVRKWNRMKLHGQKRTLSEICIGGDSEDPVIRLNRNRKCPMLDTRGLCRIVSERGGGDIPENCRQYPRQVQRFPDRIEYTLNPGCPVVVDFLERMGPLRMVMAGSDKEIKTDMAFKPGSGPGADEKSLRIRIMAPEEGTSLQSGIDEAAGIDSLFRLRLKLHEILCDQDLSLGEAQICASLLLLDARDPGKQIQRGSGSAAREAGEKNVLRQNASVPEPMHAYKELLCDIRKQERPSASESMRECNELFLDVIENYRREGMYGRFLKGIAELAKAISEAPEEQGELNDNPFFEKISPAVLYADEENRKDDIPHYKHTVSWDLEKDHTCFGQALKPFEPLLKKTAAMELFAGAAYGEGPDELILMAEWTWMEIAVIKHAVYLQWLLSGKQLSRDMVKNSIMVMARIMGFCHEDVFSYIEECFENRVWPVSYILLLTGG